MDELIARLNGYANGEPKSSWRAVVLREAAAAIKLLSEDRAALRASAERERELREALDFYSCNCKSGDCEHGTPEQGEGFISCGFRARSILNKHKEKANDGI